MYANPLGPHHITYLRMSKKRCDKLIVILNNDHQAILKHGRTFMKLKDRIKIIRELKCVDFVVASIDVDKTVCQTLESIRPNIFFNGGDQTSNDIPEAAICKELNIKMVDQMGSKTNSSSWILKNYMNSFIED